MGQKPKWTLQELAAGGGQLVTLQLDSQWLVEGGLSCVPCARLALWDLYIRKKNTCFSESLIIAKGTYLQHITGMGKETVS